VAFGQQSLTQMRAQEAGAAGDQDSFSHRAIVMVFGGCGLNRGIISNDAPPSENPAMSAICGIVNFDGKPVERADLEIMVESSPYRGPDGTGYWLEGNAGFAHLAFQLTPESVHEQQPLISADRRYVLCADVRLDNRDELFGKLGFCTDPERVVTDPDLIMAAWFRWGTACPEHLLGDFVFSIWDNQAKKLFLARDPLGGFGVSYHLTNTGFYFSSEVSALLALPEIPQRINEDAVLKTIGSLQLDEDESFFEEIRQVRPAHWLTIGTDHNQESRYWAIDPEYRVSYRSEEEYTEHFSELMSRALECRMRTLFPIGLSLSGGHDSTLLAGLAGQAGKPLHCFSYVFDHFESCDEREFIEPVTRAYDLEWTQINGDRLWSFANLGKTPVPRDFLWTNCYAQLPRAIADAARDNGCRVLLDGMVGDALFCEPGRAFADLIRQGQFRKILNLFRTYPENTNWRRDLWRNGLKPLAPNWTRAARRRIRSLNVEKLVPGLHPARSKAFLRLYGNNWSPYLEDHFSRARRLRLNNMFQPAWAHGMTATRTTPHNNRGIERFSPYFDRRLMTYVMAIPVEHVSHPGRPRRLQNNLMQRVLPKKVWRRTDKTGFEPLLRFGMMERETDTVRSLVRRSRLASQSWIRPDWLDQVIADEQTLQHFLTPTTIYLQVELWLRAIESTQSDRDNGTNLHRSS
jgi:asparagine synthase (glutamine-hydrolysing)